MHRARWNLGRLVFPLLLVFVLGTLGGCIVRTSGTGHTRKGVRHNHRHCHNKVVKKKRGRDHRKARARKCHRHPHRHPHH